jgi:hypothetical protein
MKHIKFIVHSSLILGFSGCKTSRMMGDWCSISANPIKDSADDAATNALVFEEYKGVLVARILKCGINEHYLGSNPFSKSSVVIPSGYRQADMRWDGKLSCNDAQAAFPQDSTETASLLERICKEIDTSPLN